MLPQAFCDPNARNTADEKLYQEYARPCRLYESILLILKTANTRLDEVCDAVWKQLLVDANAKANALGVPNAQVVGEKLIDLLRRFYPSEGAPIGESLCPYIDMGPSILTVDRHRHPCCLLNHNGNSWSCWMDNHSDATRRILNAGSLGLASPCIRHCELLCVCTSRIHTDV